MTMIVDPTTDVPVRKSITVQASVERAFQVYTEGFDSWWPRSHHLGDAPLEQAVIEPRVNGRCYGRSVDGTICPWATILVWEPPRRFVMAWQITPDWKYQPDLAQSSEVEVRFTPEPDGRTRVDLEHRCFHRHGAGADAVRQGVDSDQGWGMLIALYAERVISAA
jgi:uncharacterized protein YndB with AHSA1/START domain